MIASLTGVLKSKSPTEVLIDVNGVGYQVQTSVATYETLGELGSQITLLTHLHVREDALQLFGFSSEAERQMFRLLISVSGIGPRIAQGILSGIPLGDLKQHIATGNIAGLTGIPNVGRKTAERLIVELRDKVGDLREGVDISPHVRKTADDVKAETLSALISLGYNRVVAEKALRNALQDSNSGALTIEGLIKLALKHAGGR